MRRTLYPVNLPPRSPFIPLAPETLELPETIPANFLSLPGDVQRLITDRYLSLEDLEILRLVNKLLFQRLEPVYRKKRRELELAVESPIKIPKVDVQDYLRKLPERFGILDLTSSLSFLYDFDGYRTLGKEYENIITEYQSQRWGNFVRYQSRKARKLTNPQEAPLYFYEPNIENYDFLTQYRLYSGARSRLYARYRILYQLIQLYTRLSVGSIEDRCKLNSILVINGYILRVLPGPLREVSYTFRFRDTATTNSYLAEIEKENEEVYLKLLPVVRKL